MAEPHKHRDLIVQWANGAEVQVKQSNNSWLTLPTDPCWYDDWEFRIKPQTIKYRVALIKGKDYATPLLACTKSDVVMYESYSNFSHWLTDWVEVEV